MTDTPDTEFIYGRIRVPANVAKRFMTRDGVIFRDSTGEDGTAWSEATVFVHAKTRGEAMAMAKDVLALGLELEALARDLQEFIAAHVGGKWPS